MKIQWVFLTASVIFIGLTWITEELIFYELGSTLFLAAVIFHFVLPKMIEHAKTMKELDQYLPKEGILT